MKHLLIKLLVLLIILLGLDQIIGISLAKMFFANKSGAPGFVLNHIIDKPYDAYVMGASGAQRGYIPSVFERELNLKVFNTGEAGTNIFHNYAALQLLLKHHTPKFIIWDLTNADYYYRPDASKTGMITPYYREASIRKLLYDLDSKNRLWLFSKIYPFNQKLLSICGDLLGTSNTRDAGDRGYHPIKGMVDIDLSGVYLQQFAEEEQSVRQRSQEDKERDQLIRKYFHAFIELCKANHIKLVAFHSPKAPLNDKIASTPLVDGELQEQLDKYGIPLFSIMPSEYPEMRSLNLYYDFSHLNHSGAEVYSTIVASRLRETLFLP